MNKSHSHKAPDANTIFTRLLADDVRLEASVSLCVFMFQGYPLQIKITLSRTDRGDLGIAYAIDNEKTARNYCEADVSRLLDRVAIKPCTRCSTPAFDPSTVETNRDGLCEACFVAELELKLKAEIAKAEQKRADKDRRMKDLGMTHRVSAWVHHEQDDYKIDWYFPGRPKARLIQQRLRNEGSEILDDYEIIAL